MQLKENGVMVHNVILNSTRNNLRDNVEANYETNTVMISTCKHKKKTFLKK